MELFDPQPYAGKRVCVALSGGRDSAALLHAFTQCADRYEIVLSALTCEHGIRGEASRADLAFSQQLCREWKVPLTLFHADIPARAEREGRGLEETARIWRYECFASVLEGNVDVVATAHHLDDFAETVLFRLARGTSLAGLNAFPAREGIVRPLLHRTREEIDAYVAAHRVPYVEDESNADERFTRNYLRHTVLPALEKGVPGAKEHLVAFARRAAEDDALLTRLALQALHEGEGAVYVPLGLPRPLFFRACREALRRCGVTTDYTAAHLQSLAGLWNLQSGRRVTLPRGVVAIREGEEVAFCREEGGNEEEVPVSLGTFPSFCLQIGEGNREGALRIDLDRLPQEGVIRTRREGDVFTPFGGGSKPLKKFLTDRKIPARLGHRLPVLAVGREVLAVVGVEISPTLARTRNTLREGYLYTSLRTPDYAKE